VREVGEKIVADLATQPGGTVIEGQSTVEAPPAALGDLGSPARE
jgi:hypothetical protein